VWRASWSVRRGSSCFFHVSPPARPTGAPADRSRTRSRPRTAVLDV
jgi:hypothetical protein